MHIVKELHRFCFLQKSNNITTNFLIERQVWAKNDWSTNSAFEYAGLNAPARVWVEREIYLLKLRRQRGC